MTGPKFSLPLLDETLLERQCRWLAAEAIGELAILAGDEAGDPVSNFPERLSGVAIHVFRSPEIEGSAGALRGARDFVGDDPFVLFHHNVLPIGLRLTDLRARQATIAVAVETRPESLLHDICVGADGSVSGFVRHHPSRERRRPTNALEVYVCSPEVFRHIPEVGYVDFKEELIPKLLAADERIEAVACDGQVRLIDGAGAYLAAVHELIELRARGAVRHGNAEWIAKTARIADSAVMTGPVFIGPGAVIEDNATLVGPCVIGEGTRVRRGALVRESVLWRNGDVGRGAVLHGVLLAETQKVSNGSFLERVARAGFDESIESASELPWSPPQTTQGHQRPWLRRAIRRAFDASVSTLGLVALAPLITLIALLVRAESAGPAFYSEIRAGRHGRDFRIYKFRTMRQDAASMQKALLGESEREGPTFKIASDPRITRIGRFLRSTSLDELPQLYNVVRGDLSFVGPRPLKIDEMTNCPQWRDLRTSVRPGIAGLWQLHARRSRRFADWLQWDSRYVLEGPSLRRDLRILARTAFSVVTGRNPGE